MIHRRACSLASVPSNEEEIFATQFVQAQLGEHEAAARAAKELRDSAPKHPARLYTAAQVHALSACALLEDCASGRRQKQITELQRNYVDAAVRSLGDAVANGYKNAVDAAHDPALQSVRNDDGFRKLLNGLQR